MRVPAVFCSVLFLGACEASESPPGNVVVVYVSHDLVFSRPILKDFERQSGLRVRIVGDTEASKTTGLALKLLRLKDRPEADVFWNNEVVRTVQLADLGLLEAYVPATAVGIPLEHCDGAGRWVGFAARARVLLYNTELIDAADAPKSIFDLTDERYRAKVAIANPLFGTTATHVAALFDGLGADRAKEFLIGLKENEVFVAAGNAMARNMVRDGRLPICLTDTDDANGAILSGAPVAMIYPDQSASQIGTLVIPNSVGLVKGAPHAAAGKRLVDYLVSKAVEERLARSKAAQMPLRPNSKPHSEQFDLSRVKAMKVDWNRVVEQIRPSSEFVRKVFLQ